MRDAIGLRTGLFLTGLWIMSLLFLAGCVVPYQPSDGTPVAAASPSLGALPPSPTHSSPTSTSNFQSSTDCGYQWANLALIDLTGQVQAAIDAADIQGVTLLATAFGENCLDQTGVPVSFLAMQTDFHLTVEAASLEDTGVFGDRLAETLAVLSQFPPESTPGPKPGTITVRLSDGDKEFSFVVPWQDALDALSRGLTGKMLWDDLYPKNLP